MDNLKVCDRSGVFTGRAALHNVSCELYLSLGYDRKLQNHCRGRRGGSGILVTLDSGLNNENLKDNAGSGAFIGLAAL